MIDALEEAKCIPFTDPSWGLNGTYNHWVLSVILSSFPAESIDGDVSENNG